MEVGFEVVWVLHIECLPSKPVMRIVELRKRGFCDAKLQGDRAT